MRAALEEGIQILELVAPLSILGTEEGNVSGIRCQRMQLGEPDARGRRSPVPVPGSEFNIRVDKVLVAIGEAPDPTYRPGEDC